MPSLQPEQATFLLQAVLLPALTSEHAITQRVIEAIPDDKGDFAPHPVSRTALDLAWHIVSAEHRFFDAVCSGNFDYTPVPRPDSARAGADISGWNANSFRQDLARVAATSPEQLMTPIDFRGLFKLPAVTFLQIAINHTIHHRGQLSAYLRQMGARVPSIYGHSWDDLQDAAKRKEAN